MDATLGVALSVYNGEHTVGKAIDSIIRQSYRDWVMVLVDDGSTDGTLAVLNQYAALDPRIRVLRHDRKMGLAVSLNDAIAALGTDLIARMDADDFCLEERFEKQYAYMGADPKIDVLGTWASVVDDDGQLVGQIRTPTDHEAIAQEIFRRNPFVHPSIMMRRKFFLAAGQYDPFFERGQDRDLWLRSFKLGRFANLPEYLIIYRRPKIKLKSVYYSSLAIWRELWREKKPLLAMQYALRPFLALLWHKIVNYYKSFVRS